VKTYSVLLLYPDFIANQFGEAYYTFAGTPDVYVVVTLGCVRYVSSTEDINVTVVDTDCRDDNAVQQKEMLETADSLARYW
jgi:hypothetical protein